MSEIDASASIISNILPTNTTNKEVILEQIRQSRYLAAYESYLQFNNDSLATNIDTHNDNDNNSFTDFNEEQKKMIEAMIERVMEIKTTLESVNSNDIREVNPSEKENPWILGANYFGISTYYKRSPIEGDSSLIIKMEGTLENLPLFEQCAVIHEIDLFKEWIPFCNESFLIDKIGNAEIIA